MARQVRSSDGERTDSGSAQDSSSSPATVECSGFKERFAVPRAAAIGGSAAFSSGLLPPEAGGMDLRPAPDYGDVHRPLPPLPAHPSQSARRRAVQGPASISSSWPLDSANRQHEQRTGEFTLNSASFPASERALNPSFAPSPGVPSAGPLAEKLSSVGYKRGVGEGLFAFRERTITFRCSSSTGTETVDDYIRFIGPATAFAISQTGAIQSSSDRRVSLIQELRASGGVASGRPVEAAASAEASANSGHQGKQRFQKQRFQYGTDSDPIEAMSSPEDYARKRDEVLSQSSADGTDQARSDVAVTPGPGAVDFFSIAALVLWSGYLDVDERTANSAGFFGPHARGGGKAAISGTFLDISRTARWLAAMFDPNARMPTWLQDPVDWLIDDAPLSESVLDLRRDETSRVFVLFGCCFYTLLEWLGARDSEYGFNIPERRVSYAGVPAAASLERLSRRGAPAVFSMQITGKMRADRRAYNPSSDFSKGNHRSVLRDEAKLRESLADDVKRRFAIIMSPFVQCIVPTIFPIPLGIVERKKDGKQRPILDCSFVGPGPPELDASDRPLPGCTNDAMSKHSVTKPIYGSAIDNICWKAYNLRIAHPNEPIFCFLLDTDSAYRRCKHNWRILPVMVVLIFGALYFSVGLNFGEVMAAGEYSLPEESVLAVMAGFTIESIASNAEALAFAAGFERDIPTVESSPLLQPAFRDRFNPGIEMLASSPLTFADVFVDDDILLSIFGSGPFNFLKLSLAALLWAKLCFFPEGTGSKRRSFVNMKKFQLSQWCRTCIVLGYWMDFDRLEISCPVGKLDDTLTIIRNWRSGARYMGVKDVAALIGNVRFLSGQLPGGCFLSIRLNATLQESLSASSTSRAAAWRSRKFVDIPANLLEELDHLEFYLEDEVTRAIFLTSPMSRRLWHEPAHVISSDASRWGGGARCGELGFGFRFEWPESVREFFDTTKNINALEYLALIISFCMMTAFHCDAAALVPVLFFTDNTSAKAWAGIACLPSAHLAALSRALGVFMALSRLISKTDYVEGPKNVEADALSRELPAGSAVPWSYSASPIANTNTASSSATLPLKAQPKAIVLIPVPDLLISILSSAMLSNSSPTPAQLIQDMKKIVFDFSQVGCGQKPMLR